MRSKTGSAGNGGGSANSPRCFARAAQGTQGRVFDGGFIVVRQGQFNQAEEVLKHFWIALYRRLPIFINASLQLRLGSGKLVGVRGGAVVVVCVSP
jgi:hypothetical protein